MVVAAGVVAVDVGSDFGGELLYVECDVLPREERAFERAATVMMPPDESD